MQNICSLYEAKIIAVCCKRVGLNLKINDVPKSSRKFLLVETKLRRVGTSVLRTNLHLISQHFGQNFHPLNSLFCFASIYKNNDI